MDTRGREKKWNGGERQSWQRLDRAETDAAGEERGERRGGRRRIPTQVVKTLHNCQYHWFFVHCQEYYAADRCSL